ncbi:hypothetical protein FVE85_0263 [Porphyridium purpureum]|uniref:Uncharacterized protein n=1 Tax=Porphyridium purpureum TaxID=35688 RepID=A0A5J4Z0Q5_PORPP|nr:hypothetical protein FVE85_0263 [Porphyridium purpureum]|eukprot:POR6572..scf208_2
MEQAFFCPPVIPTGNHASRAHVRPVVSYRPHRPTRPAATVTLRCVPKDKIHTQTGTEIEGYEWEVVVKALKENRYGKCTTCRSLYTIPGLTHSFCAKCGWVSRGEAAQARNRMMESMRDAWKRDKSVEGDGNERIPENLNPDYN